MTMHERMRIFEAVFPSDLETTAPTPAATPQLGSSSFGASFGGFQEAKAPADDEAAERVKWDRAWHTATTYLSLPRTSVTLAQALRQERLDEGRWIKAASREVAAAVEYLVSDQSPGHRRRAHDESADILHWYLQEVTEHYFKYQLSSLLRVSPSRFSNIECIVSNARLDTAIDGQPAGAPGPAQVPERDPNHLPLSRATMRRSLPVAV